MAAHPGTDDPGPEGSDATARRPPSGARLMGVVGVLFAFGTALSFTLMNLAIRQGGRVHPGENAVLPTIVVNIAAFSVIFCAAAATGSLLEIRGDAVLAFMSIGLTGAFLGRTFLFAGIDRIGVVRASALKNATPIVTLLIAVVLIGERFTLLGIAGIVLILVAVFAVIRESLIGYRIPPAAVAGEAGAIPAFAGAAAMDRQHVLPGVVLAGLSAVAFGASNALAKVGLNIVPDMIQAGTFGAWAAFTAFLVLAAARRELGAAGRAMLAPRPWFWLAGVFGTVGQLAFFAALHFAPVGAVTVVAASEVVLTTMLAGLLVQRVEQVTRRIAIPVLLVFVGAAMIAVSR
jgi:drug/metabolite transporter (DMT)-like permease